VTAPTRENPTGVYVYHNTEDGLSVAVELADNGDVTLALAICSPRDSFSKKKAQMIMRRRLQKKRFLGETPRTIPLPPYTGGSFKSDVFEPIIDFIRDESENFFLRKGERGDQNALIRELASELVDVSVEYMQPVVV
jgi:hypothetical protein